MVGTTEQDGGRDNKTSKITARLMADEISDSPVQQCVLVAAINRGGQSSLSDVRQREKTRNRGESGEGLQAMSMVYDVQSYLTTQTRKASTKP